MGVSLATSSIPFGTGTSGSYSTSESTYDQAGRLASDSSYDYDGTSGASWGNSTTRQYDAENHTIQESYTGDPSENSITTYGAANYAWGPNEHPVAIGSGYSTTTFNPTVAYDTLHWDGSQLLFTTNASGQVDDIKVGDIADITSAGLIFYDRGFGNEVSFCHSKGGYGGNGSDVYVKNGGRLGPLAQNPCGTLAGAPSGWSGTASQYAISNGVGKGAILVMPRSDGLSDGYNTIQGSRSMDTSIGTWTTPDAYSGDVQDPATQKSYMWNGNNPVSYADPSGYAFNTLGSDSNTYGDLDSYDDTDTACATGCGGATTGNASAPSMSLSAKGLDFIKQHEGYSGTTYYDSAGNATIGYGHLIKRGENFDKGITQAEATVLLADDTQAAIDAVRTAVKANISQNKFDALVDFAYNVGSGGLARSNLFKNINSGGEVTRANFTSWDHAGGMVILGLKNRRIDEYQLFTKGIY